MVPYSVIKFIVSAGPPCCGVKIKARKNVKLPASSHIERYNFKLRKNFKNPIQMATHFLKKLTCSLYRYVRESTIFVFNSEAISVRAKNNQFTKSISLFCIVMDQ